MSDPASTPARRPQRREDARATLVTERDCQLLAFVAEHRFVLPAHVQMLLGVSESVASRRLGGLTARGLLESSRVLHGQPRWYQITRPGLAMIESDLPCPRVDLRCYQHDIAVAWVWLAASRGAFGRVERTVSEREMRSRDGTRAAAERAAAAGGEPAVDVGEDPGALFGARLGGVGRGGRIRLHYPDLLLIGRGGERVAVELELSAKGGRRLETILAGYGADPSVAAVLYLVEKPGIARDIRSAAARLGISHLVHVQQIARPSSVERSGGAGRVRGAAAMAGARAAGCGPTPAAPAPAPAAAARLLAAQRPDPRRALTR